MLNRLSRKWRSVFDPTGWVISVKKDESFFVRFITTTLKNSFQIVLSISLIALGLRGFLTGLEYPLAFSNGFPPAFMVFYLSLAIIGGTCSLFGVYLSFRSFWFSGLERFGLYLSAPAWGSYAIVTYLGLFTKPNIIEYLEFFLFFGISLACLFRADFVNKKSEHMMNVLRVTAASQLKVDDV